MKRSALKQFVPRVQAGMSNNICSEFGSQPCLTVNSLLILTHSISISGKVGTSHAAYSQTDVLLLNYP